MNSRWLRDNLSVLIFIVVFLAALAGLVVSLQRATEKQRLVNEELEQQKSALGALKGEKVYPSKDNIDLIKRDTELVNSLYQEMERQVSRDPITPPPLDRGIDFSQFMRKTTADLNTSAKAAGIQIPDQFLWGFSRYDSTFPCVNPVAQGDDCKKLLSEMARQLLAIEKLSHLIIASKVDAITGLRRTEIEPGTAGADALDVAVTKDPKGLFHVYPFELSFTANTEGVRSLLNKLATADNFFIVRNLKVDSIVVAAKEGLTASDVPAINVEPGKAVKAVNVSASRRLNVTMRVDLIEFTPTKPAPGKS